MAPSNATPLAGTRRQARRALRRVCWTLAVMLSALAALPAAAGELDGLSEEPGGLWATDTQGRRFRVAFDPGSRLFFDVHAATGDFAAVDTAFRVGAAYRTFSESGAGDTFVSWQVENRFVDATVAPWRPAFGEAPTLSATLWAGSFRRHTAEPYVTVPTTTPYRLAFPFDIGIDANVGRVSLAPATDSARDVLRAGLLRGAIFLDPWRSGRPGTGFELGPAFRYDLEVVRRNTTDGTTVDVIHRVAPLSALFARLRWQDGRGLTTFDLRGELAPHWVSTGGWQTLVESTARLERTLVAINDWPVGLFVSGQYARTPAFPGESAQQQWQASGGLVLGVPLSE